MSADLPGRGLRVLITRAPLQAEKTAQALSKLGFVPVIAPLLSLGAINPNAALPERLQAILITSANAIPALAALKIDPGIPILCVGDATSDAASAVGFKDVRSAQGDARALAQLALTKLDPAGGAILHLRGEKLAHDPLTALAQEGFETQAQIAYRAGYRDQFDEGALAVLRAAPPLFALSYSPASSRNLASALAGAGLEPLEIVAISAAAAQPLTGAGFALSVAEHPSETAMLDELIKLAEKQHCGRSDQGL